MNASVQKYTETILHDASTTYADTAMGIADMKLSMAHLIERTRVLKSSVVGKHRRSVNDLYESLAAEMIKVSNEIQEEFPPPDRAEHHVERTQVISRILAKIEGGVVRAVAEVGISESEARVHFEAMEPHIRNVLVATGDLVELHPTIAEVLLFSVAAFAVPEAWLLRPIFGIFGFGPSGTLKGSTAAWAQRRFFGGYIPSGSWFSRLQSASMGGVGLGKKVGAGIGAGIGAGVGLLGWLFSGSGCGGR